MHSSSGVSTKISRKAVAPVNSRTIRRDPKGLYAKAKSGRFENFTGLDSAYEAPDAPEIRVATLGVAPEAAAEHILGELRRREIV